MRAAACQTTETAETRAHEELEADAERKRLCELTAHAACAPCPALWLVPAAGKLCQLLHQDFVDGVFGS